MRVGTSARPANPANIFGATDISRPGIAPGDGDAARARTTGANHREVSLRAKAGYGVEDSTQEQPATCDIPSAGSWRVQIEPSASA